MYLSKKAYCIAEKVSCNMWANNKPGKYGKGILNSPSDPYRTERTGLLGEIAFAKLFDINPDFSYKEFGHKYDFIFQGKKIDVKTTTHLPFSGLVYAENEWGNKIEIESDIFVFAFLEREDRINKTAVVALYGWIDRDNLMKCNIEKSRYGNHKNYVVKYDQLRNMKELNGK